MDQTVLKIALAGLMHDIGKFAQGGMEISSRYANDNADQYQPFYNNHHTHVHVLYTAAFIEQFADRLPPELNRDGWGEGDSFVNLAAGHHKPETAMQWIVAQADRISSGLDRDSFEEGEKIAYRDFRKTRLLPIFEELSPDDNTGFENRDQFRYRYNLAPLSSRTLFPEKYDEQDGGDSVEQDYQALFDTFVHQLGLLQDRGSDMELWSSHLDSLLQTCTAMIPAARVGDVVHDVSLYDHARTTAAFASALYEFHRQGNTLNENDIRNGNSEKLLLVTGDFYGIQDFIFSSGGETARFRSKLLRGRSFAVSLFSELAADMMCRELGLTSLSVVFNAAGKFTLIAPNTEQVRKVIKKVAATVNDWLYEVSCGQASMGIAVTAGSPAEFSSGAYAGLHDRHMRDLQEIKKQKLDLEKYGGAVSGFLDSFDPELARPLCSLCGKRPATAAASGDHAVLGENPVSACPVCRDHVMIGTGVVKKSRIAVLNSNEPAHRGLLRPLLGCYQLTFSLEGDFIRTARVLKKWQVSPNPDGTLLTDITMRPLNGYVPCYREEDLHDDRLLESRRSEEKTLALIDQVRIGEPKTFSHIASAARVKTSSGGVRGTEAIAVLKADVDNLGVLMGCGLPETRFTLSRMATLSRQLDAFFSIYLPDLLAGREEFRDMYTVFAGGDDLFLIGPWNRMAELALYLRERFAAYVCHNMSITFSAGISLHKPHVPVDRLAESAEDALEQAKDRPEKNSVTMFGQAVSWDDFDALQQNRDAMQAWLDQKYISSGMMYRFNHLITLAGRERAALESGSVVVTDLDAMKWRSMFAYSVQRNINTSLKGAEREQAVEDVSLMAGWMDRYGAAVRIPLWHLLYDKR